MRLLDRYLLRELLIPLGYCLSGFLIFWIAFDLFTDLAKYQEKKLLLQDVAELYMAKLPELLVIILPIALLLALLYTLTNHARHHELTAIRAAGVSLARICLPYLAVAFVLSLASFALSEYWVPESADREDAIMHKYEAKVPGAPGAEQSGASGLNNSRDGHNWTWAGYNSATGVLSGPVVTWASGDGMEHRLLAKHGENLNGVWTFHDVWLYTGKPGEQLAPILQTNELAMPEFLETRDQIRREIKFDSFLDKRSRQAQEPDVPIAYILDYLDLHPNDLSPQNKSKLYTQLYGHLAAPFTCLLVVLIAIPFGAASGRRNLFAGVAMSIVICFAYFVLLKLGLAAGEGGFLPPWLGAWFPNLAFGLTAVWLLLRVR